MESKYDVFISKNNADLPIALELAHVLTRKGFRVFESSESLPKMARSEYSDAIDNALDNSSHLLVICSKNENGQNSRWVKKEWQSFRNEVLSERKNGNIVVLLVGGIRIADLAFGLREYQAFDYETFDIDQLILYFPRENESRSNDEIINKTPESEVDDLDEPEETNESERIVKLDELSFRMIHVEGGVYQSKRIDSFYLGQFPVTQNIWENVMGNNPSRFPDIQSSKGGRWKSVAKDAAKGFVIGGPLMAVGRGIYSYIMHDSTSDTGHLPVENVNYYEALEFVERLSEMTGLHFSLPTEMEWEYAAKGGIFSNDYVYAGGDDIDTVGWYKENSSGKTHPVGEKIPNELGLYDMSGNVWEWVLDSSPVKGIGVRKGGSWHQVSTQCLCTNRHLSDRNKKTSGLGLRVLMR